MEIENNSSSSDTVMINSLVDNPHIDLNGRGTCTVPQTIAAGSSYCWLFSAFVDDFETDFVMAEGRDNENSNVSDSDIEPLTIGLDAENNTIWDSDSWMVEKIIPAIDMRC